MSVLTQKAETDTSTDRAAEDLRCCYPLLDRLMQHSGSTLHLELDVAWAANFIRQVLEKLCASAERARAAPTSSSLQRPLDMPNAPYPARALVLWDETLAPAPPTHPGLAGYQVTTLYLSPNPICAPEHLALNPHRPDQNLINDLKHRSFDVVAVYQGDWFHFQGLNLIPLARHLGNKVMILSDSDRFRLYEGEDIHRLQYNASYLKSMFMSSLSIQGGEVLEVGCSDGLVCGLMLSKNPERIVGVDLLDNVGGRFPDPRISYHRMDGSKLEFPDGRFDLCYSIATLEHCREPWRVLQEMARVTKPGGLCYVQAGPLYHAPFGHHMFGYFDDYPWIHLRLSKSEIAAHARATGAAERILQTRNQAVEAYLEGMLSPAHINGLTLSEYRIDKFLETPGIELLDFRKSYEGKDALTPAIKKELHTYWEEDLVGHGFELVFRRAEEARTTVGSRQHDDHAPPVKPLDVKSIYPIAIPPVSIQADRDMLLMDLPARSIAQMPAGFAYVHNALKRTGIKLQTIDFDILLYHRFHSRRILGGISEVRTKSGYRLPEDPWQPVHYLEWEKPEFLEYFRSDIEEIVSAIITARPTIIGLSLQQTNLSLSRRLIASVREALPEVVFVVGGMSCLQPGAAKMVMPEADYTVVGEADLVIGPLVEALVRGERPADVPGVWSRYDTPDRVFKPGPLPYDLDAMDFPRYEFTDIRLYQNWNGYRLVPVIGSRGCHWAKCRFCGERFQWRCRSPKLVADEIEWLNQHGFANFVFNESDLHGEPKIIEMLCDEVINRGLKITMTAQLRCHPKVDKRYFEKLHRAGFVCLRFGIDGGSVNTLRIERKGYTRDMITRNLRDSSQAGIFNEVNLIIGLPGETDTDIDETIAFFTELKPYIGRLAFLNPLMLFRGSDFWDHPEQFGIQFSSDRESLMRRYLVAIPDHEWFSTEPYIDKNVRYQRFVKVVNAFRAVEIPMGDFASFTAERVLKKTDDDRRSRRAKQNDDDDCTHDEPTDQKTIITAAERCESTHSRLSAP